MTYYMTSTNTFYVDSNDLSEDVVGSDLGDTILAGGGNDTIEGGLGADDINGGAGIDIIDGGEGGDTLWGWDGSDVLKGGNGDDFLYGDDNSNAYAGNDTLEGGVGNDTLYGGRGSDTYIYNAGDGYDTIYNLHTYQTDDGATDVLALGAGILPSDVVLSRGTGFNADDLFISFAGSSTDKIEMQSYFAGEGLDGHAVDEIRFANGTVWNIATVKAMVLASTEGDDYIRGYASNDVIDAGGGNDIVYGNDGIDIIHGGAGNDSQLVGGSGNDTIYGDAGSDTLYGEGDNDVLDGGLDGDTMYGGAGDDTYVVDNVSDQVSEVSGEGTDTVQSSINYALGAYVEKLTLLGAGAINATGNGLDNVLIGNGSANVLDGGAGADSLQGGDGNDTYIVDNAFDTVVENSGGGVDTVEASVSYTLTNNIENLTLSGTGAINGTGNALDNTLTGNTGSNVLDGGAGNDTMSGGAGDDYYYVDSVSDVVVEQAGAGLDRIYAGFTYSLEGVSNVEYLTLTGSAAINGTGNDLDNRISGNDAVNTLTGGLGNDTLNGFAGNDTMIGGQGNDTYYVHDAGDVTQEATGEGTDLVYSYVNHSLQANVENLNLLGSAITGVGNDLNNTMTGNSQNNVLEGGQGNDIMDGGAGVDTLRGGLGDDIYVIGADDIVEESAGEGTDRINTTFTASLLDSRYANIENLKLTGTGNFDATGNGGNNLLIGNGGDNVLDGREGNDTMQGGAGNDTFVVDSTSDSVSELSGEGTDTVQSSVNFTLGSNVENLTLTGTGNTTGVGNSLNNLLIGNSGINILNGALGTDTLRGGLGDDVYVIDGLDDVVEELSGEGVDRINTTFTASLQDSRYANIENLKLTGTGNFDATGNSGNNLLIGNAGNNVLDGREGNDTMQGGAGNDTYIVDSTADVVTELSGEGTDTVQSSVTYTLGSNVEGLTLTGGSAINGTGNAAANVLTGNGAANTLTGGAGNDSYVFEAGFGSDTVVENDSTSGNTDQANFGTGINHDQLWFTHSGNDLVVQRIGTSDTVVFSNWYSGSANHVEQFHSGNGKTLVDSQVESLVSAMASLTPPGTGETTLSQAYQDQLASTLAASWA